MLVEALGEPQLELAQQRGMHVQPSVSIEEDGAAELRKALQRAIGRFEGERSACGEPRGGAPQVSRLEDELLRLCDCVVARKRLERFHVGLPPPPAPRSNREDATAADGACVRA